LLTIVIDYYVLFFIVIDYYRPMSNSLPHFILFYLLFTVYYCRLSSIAMYYFGLLSIIIHQCLTPPPTFQSSDVDNIEQKCMFVFGCKICFANDVHRMKRSSFLAYDCLDLVHIFPLLRLLIIDVSACMKRAQMGMCVGPLV
jgi:hypothetical protein